MGTVVTFQVVGAPDSAGVARAVDWFRTIEACCTRFDEASELRQLCARVGDPVAVSEMLFQALEFSVMVAEESGGAFDPTAGPAMIAGSSFRDVSLDAERRTVTLRRPLMLDLGGVAKGLAVDAAARELQPFGDFAIDAGGDLYLGGSNASGTPWTVGIRHPRDTERVIESVIISNAAVCTSGDYEALGIQSDGSHHIIDPRTGRSANELASVTVIASSAMVADALGTAAFVLGPTAGIALLERHGVRGVLYTPSLERFETHA